MDENQWIAALVLVAVVAFALILWAYERGRAVAFKEVRERPATLSDETVEAFGGAIEASQEHLTHRIQMIEREFRHWEGRLIVNMGDAKELRQRIEALEAKGKRK